MQISYETFVKSLNNAASKLNNLSYEFDILKHEIQQMNSENSKKFLEILEANSDLFDILKCKDDSSLNTIYSIIENLINLKINQFDDLNLVRVFLIIYFSIFIRAHKSDDRESYKKIYELIENSHINDFFSPLLFFIGIFNASRPNSMNENIEIHLRKIIKYFAIFDIIRVDWLKRAYHTFTKQSYKIFNHTMFFALEIFFYTINFSSSTGNFDNEKIFPLLAYVLKHQSKNDPLDSDFINNFLLVKNNKTLSDRFDKSFIYLSSKAIKSPECAGQIWEALKEKKFQNFLKDLQKSLNELTVNDSNYEDKAENVLNTIRLLYKFSKYLDFQYFVELIIGCFLPRSTGINSSESKEYSCFITFIYFITDFLWKPKFCTYAAKILEQLTQKYSTFMAVYYDQLFKERFSDVFKTLDYSSNNHRLIIAFLKASAHFIYYHFSYEPPINELPAFVKYFIFDFFPSAVYRKYKTQKAQWKVFTELIRTANDLFLTDYSSLLLAHEDKKFLPALITLINYAANNIYISFRGNIEKSNSDKDKDNDKNKSEDLDDSDDDLEDDSEVSPLSYKDSALQIKFERKALKLLHNLISIHILRNEKPTHLYKELFNDQWISKLIASLTNFLRLEAPKYQNENYYKIQELRSYSFNIFELLCKACHEIGNDSFEVYYPRTFQKIYNNIIYGTLCNPNDCDEVIRVIDFASSVLETQKTFAYSLIRQTFFSLITQALDQFNPDEISNDTWRIYASLSNLISKLFINLDTKSDIMQKLIFPEVTVKKSQGSESEIPKHVESQNKIHKNPTPGTDLSKPSDNCKQQEFNFSVRWCTVIDFIFDKNFDKVIDNGNKILVMARLLKSVICIFLYMECPPPGKTHIQTFLQNFFQHLFDKEKKSGNFTIQTQTNINLNDFKSYIMYPNPDEYYIDIYKLDWYLKNKDPKLIEDVKALNEKLYLINCKTELISSVHSFIRLLLILDDQETDQQSDSKNDDYLLDFIIDALTINFLPITTIEAIFNLFETIIMSPKMQKTFFSDIKIRDTLTAASKFLKIYLNDDKSSNHLNSVIFRVITKLLELTDDNESEFLNENDALVDLFTIAYKSISIENPNENATSLICEISKKSSNVPILEGENAILYMSFYKSVINTKYAIHALKATRILCKGKNSTESLQKVGFFDYLIQSIQPGPTELAKDSPLWQHVFSIFLSLPPSSKITTNFICKIFPYITFFLNEKLMSNKDYHANINKDTQLAQTQESIISLIAHVSKDFSALSTQSPSTAQALIELIYIQLDLAFKTFQVKSKDKVINFQNLLLIEQHNVATSNILILYFCLLIINNLISYPSAALPRGFLKADSNQKMMGILVGIIEDLFSIYEKLSEDPDIDSRLLFSKIVYQSTEMAARLFSGLSTSLLSNSNISKDEKYKVKDYCNRFKNVLKKVFDFNMKYPGKTQSLDIKALKKFQENVEKL